MKIAQIAGFLGSGKTTALLRIVAELRKKDYRIAIVVNDVGEIGVDAKFIEANGLKARDLRRMHMLSDSRFLRRDSGEASRLLQSGYNDSRAFRCCDTVGAQEGRRIL